MYRERLNAYLDREMSTAEIKEMDQHIQDCSDCTEELLLIQETNRCLLEYEERALPESIENYIREKMPMLTEAKRRSGNANWKIAFVASILFSLAFGLTLGNYAIADKSRTTNVSTTISIDQESLYAYWDGE